MTTEDIQKSIVKRTILYLSTNTSNPELAGVLPASNFEVIPVQTIVAAHKQLQSSTIDCLIIDNLQTIDVPLSDILSLLTAAYPHPTILIDGTESAEIPISHPYCRVVNSEHLDALAEKINRLIEQRNLETALSEHTELQRTVLEIIDAATKATSEDEIKSIVFEKLQQTNLFDYIWLGSYDENANDFSISFPTTGKFSIETVSEILHISNNEIFENAGRTHEIQATAAPVTTRETANANVETPSPSYQLNCVVIPFQQAGQSSGMMILGTYREDAFDAPEKQLLTTLRDVVEYLEATIDHQSSESQQSRDEIDTFVAMLVHELRSPLGIAQAYLDIGQNDGENAEESFEKVSDALRELENTIDDLASMAKNNMTAEFEEIELEPLVREVWESIDKDDGSINIESNIHFSADPALLKILFRNLLSNAIEHGGESCSIQIGSVSNGFFVEDTGSGIPNEIQEKIFTRGFSDSGGLGVGLSLVKDIVDAHGWEIAIDSEVGSGTRVEITKVTKEITSVDD